MTSLAGLLAAVTVSAVVLVVVGAAGALLTRRLWRLPALAPAGALLGLGAAATATFFAFVLSTAVGRITAVVVLIASCLVCARGLTRLDAAGRDRARTTASWTLLGLGALLVTTGVFTLWEHPGSWFDLARTRFLNPLPDDNEIPARVAAALLADQDPRTAPGGDWQSSDRPPLQTGLLLLVQATTGWTGLPAASTAFAAGLVVQVSWLPAAASVLRVLGAPPRAAALGVLFGALSGTVLVNTAFTWPKLLSAALASAALALLLSLPRQPRTAGPLTAAAVLCAFAALAHGAAVFAAPLLAWSLWAARRRLTLPACTAAAAGLVVAYLPWLLYQRLYDPPGDRLLKWHLAGVEAPTDAPLGALLADACGDVPIGQLLENKLSNVTAPLSRWPWTGLSEVLTDPTERRISEFFVLSSALGLGAVLLLVVVGARVVSVVRGTADDVLLRRSTAVLTATGVSLLFWAMVLYGPAATSVHQGSHVPVLLLLLVPATWLASRAWWTAVGATVLQGALVLTTYAQDGVAGDPRLVPAAVVLAVTGLLVCAAGVVMSGRGHGSADPAPLHDGPGSDDDRSASADTRVFPGRRSLPPVPAGPGRARPPGTTG